MVQVHDAQSGNARINDAAVIRDIELILYSGSPHYEARCWMAAGAECRRDRHRYVGGDYGFGLEILRLRFAERAAAWEVMLVTERWTNGTPEAVVRNRKWLKLVSGKPADVRSWIRRHRTRLIGAAPADTTERPNLDIEERPLLPKR